MQAGERGKDLVKTRPLVGRTEGAQEAMPDKLELRHDRVAEGEGNCEERSGKDQTRRDRRRSGIVCQGMAEVSGAEGETENGEVKRRTVDWCTRGGRRRGGGRGGRASLAG